MIEFISAFGQHAENQVLTFGGLSLLGVYFLFSLKRSLMLASGLLLTVLYSGPPTFLGFESEADLALLTTVICPILVGLMAALVLSFGPLSEQRSRPPFLFLFVLLLSLVATSSPFLIADGSSRSVEQLPYLATLAFTGFIAGFLLVALYRALVAAIPVMIWAVILSLTLIFLQPDLIEYLPARHTYEDYFLALQDSILEQSDKLREQVASLEHYAVVSSSEG